MLKIRYLALLFSILLILTVLPVRLVDRIAPIIPSARAATVPITLDGDAMNGWNGTSTNPNPTITAHAFDNVSISLVSSDHLSHRFLLDGDSDSVSDTADCPTTDPCSIAFSTMTHYSFLVNNIAAGTYTYYCTVHPLIMFGTFTIAPDFSVAANPNSIAVNPGNSASSQITVTSKSLVGSVALSATISPSSSTITTSFTPPSLSFSASGTQTSTLNIMTTTFTPLGTYTLTVTGISGSLSHTTTVTFVVASGTIGGSATKSPTSQILLPGLAALVVVSVTLAASYLKTKSKRRIF